LRGLSHDTGEGFSAELFDVNFPEVLPLIWVFPAEKNPGYAAGTLSIKRGIGAYFFLPFLPFFPFFLPFFFFAI
jgi:hypothetical protein